MGPDSYTALHRAAQASNIAALKLIKEHVELRHASRPVPYNALCRGYTVLDYALFALDDPWLLKFRRNDASENDPHVDFDEHTVRRAQSLGYDFFRLLREEGALHSRELDGCCIR